MTTTITIGENAKIIGYSVKQKGYGRQGLYLNLLIDGEKNIDGVYVQDVFPNVLEHFQWDFYLEEYAVYDEDRGVWTRDSGNGEYTNDQIFDTMEDLLNKALEGRELEVELNSNL